MFFWDAGFSEHFLQVLGSVVSSLVCLVSVRVLLVVVEIMMMMLMVGSCCVQTTSG